MVDPETLLDAIDAVSQIPATFTDYILELERYRDTEPHLIAALVRSATNVYPLSKQSSLLYLQAALVTLRALEMSKDGDVDELERWYSKIGGREAS